jgi:hypothetical protein
MTRRAFGQARSPRRALESALVVDPQSAGPGGIREVSPRSPRNRPL